jgi:hypothetical protein
MEFKIGDRVRVVSTHKGDNDEFDRTLIGREGTITRTEVGTWGHAKLPIGVELDDDGDERYFAAVELEKINDQS